MKDFVELKVHDMSTMIYPADAYVLILEEVNGVRKMPIIIGRVEAKAIKVSTLLKLCEALDCEVGDLLEYRRGDED